jgi:predicted O-methyltransferase YrrM
MTDDGPSHAGTGAAGHLDWIDDDHLRIDGIDFLVTSDSSVYRTATSDGERFLLVKPRPGFAKVTDVLRANGTGNLLELGIYQGGSVAYWNLALQPKRQLAVDLLPDRIAPLDAFVASDRCHGEVELRYGLDQADEPAVTAAVEELFGDEPLDAVIDDASHYYGETRASFEVLFPRLRPGGLYVIEDWGWAHSTDPKLDDLGVLRDRPALTNLVVELIMASVTAPDLVREVRIDSFTTIVERGPAELTSPMALADHYRNRGLPFRVLL